MSQQNLKKDALQAEIEKKMLGLWDDVSRRGFMAGSAAAGLAAGLMPGVAQAQQAPEWRTLYFDLSHEDHVGKVYYLFMGSTRYKLSPVRNDHPVLLQGRQKNRFLAAIPQEKITHVISRVAAGPAGVQASYLATNLNHSDGTWNMCAVYLQPPPSAFARAYSKVRGELGASAAFPLSAKRAWYGLPAATSMQDLLDEQDVINTTDWATALVNLHPELLSADPTSAAVIQTQHIHSQVNALTQLSQVLGGAGPAVPQAPGGPVFTENQTSWATLVPYTDTDNVTPLKADRGNLNGLNLYDARWNPKLQVPWVSSVMKLAVNAAKNDTSLGSDVTPGVSNLSADERTGKIWARNDGISTIDQTGLSAPATSDPYKLSSLTPNYNGYSLSSSTAVSDGVATVTLKFSNWYLRWLALFIKFYDTRGKVIPAAQVPGVSVSPGLDTSNDELYLGYLTPEFTIYGIPVMNSGDSVAFKFPQNAHSAKILASGLGNGSHKFQDTETVGIVMTSIFNLALPTFLIFFNIGSSVDAFVKKVVIPFATTIVIEIITTILGTPDQFITILWRAIVKGFANPTGPLQGFLEAFASFVAAQEITNTFMDAIPLVGAVLQAIGALGALAEVTETACEVVLSPWTYVYQLVGTHDLSLQIFPDPKGTGGLFPAAAATYTVTVIIDGGTPTVQTLNMPSTDTKTLPPVLFSGLPLGGNVVLSVAFYAADGTQVGHGTTGSILNDLSAAPTITITQDQVPITSATVYSHKQKTALNTAGNHYWVCAPAPAAPARQSACEVDPGNICSYRKISVNTPLGYVGYGWQSYSQAACAQGSGQLDQIANIFVANDSSGDAQAGYATTPCAITGAVQVVYDPLGRADSNYYLDTTNNANLLRQIPLAPPIFPQPGVNQTWGKFNLTATDILLHPAGAVVSINSANSRMETLLLDTPVEDANAGDVLANLHGGLGSRPGLFSAPTVSAITAQGTVVVLESGNNRLHSLDISANPIPLFKNQPEKYFLNFSETGGASTQYLDIATEFSGFIYVLSFDGSVYRLDIYHSEQTGTKPISTTLNFNAAKLAVDYWRNVYSLNYEVLTVPPNGTVPAVTEPSISQWIPTAAPPCSNQSLANLYAPNPRRLLRRRQIFSRLLKT